MLGRGVEKSNCHATVSRVRSFQPQTVGSRRKALKSQAYAGSPSTKEQNLSSSATPPEKNLDLDRANRAAQRALGNSNEDGDEDADLSDAGIASPSTSTKLKAGANRAAQRALGKSNEDGDDDTDLSDASIASPSISTRSKAGGSSGAFVNKNLSMPLVVSDDEVSSGDGSDDDYVPPSKRARGRVHCRQKVASRKNQQLKKIMPSSTQAGKGKIPLTKHRTKISAKSLSSSDISQTEIESSSSKGSASTESSTKARLNDKNDLEKSGFRIKWTPVINLRTQTTGPKKRGRPSKYLQAFIDNREALRKEMQNQVKSNSDDDSDIEIQQPTSAHQKNVKQVNVPNDDRTVLQISPRKEKGTLSRVAFQNLVRNASSAESGEGLSKMDSKSKCEQNGGKKSKSTYEVVLAPLTKGYMTNIFDNTKVAGNKIPISKIIQPDSSSRSSHNETTKGKSHVNDGGCQLSTGKNSLKRVEPPCSQSDEACTPDSAKNQRQQNVQVAKAINKDGKESSYKIILAPAASKSYADMGDNANGLPLQLKFPKAQFSHSMQGKTFRLSCPPKQSLFSKSLASSSDNRGSSVESDSNSSTLLVKKSNKLNECESSVGKKVNNGSADAQVESDSVKQDESCPVKKARKPRKSRYYTAIAGFGEDLVPNLPAKAVLFPNNLEKVFKSMTETKKAPPTKPESKTLRLMREYREKLAKNSQSPIDTSDVVEVKEKSEKSSKVVLQSLRFI
ncbi:hypothetical protein ElyMa_006335100 [Elysia marginata]|uniref:Uncharacterized protein n=1 Tax=Elysia marginata TaxID=1093978 RepID=A0AAV4HMQ4_9GAST|nr:hypothetical protein ElyMa_006335100 [Elysia marginata]